MEIFYSLGLWRRRRSSFYNIVREIIQEYKQKCKTKRKDYMFHGS